MSAAQIYRLDLAAGTLPCACVFLVFVFPALFPAAVPRSLETLRKAPNASKTYKPFEHAECFEGCFAGW